jgi:CRP-like cAMP-binding protein
MSPQPWDRNAFLAELSPSDYDLFRPHLTGFKLGRGERLQDFGQSIDHVVFPHDGVVAMTMPVRDGGGGAILVGRDSIVGAVGAAAAAPALCDAEVYIPGGAARMSASAFRRVLDQSPAIRRLTACYTAALMMQVHQTALCNAAHPVERRISRSLLEVLDRGSGFDVHLTQSTLAQMLGVQRTTVNLAAGRLETAGVSTAGGRTSRSCGASSSRGTLASATATSNTTCRACMRCPLPLWPRRSRLPGREPV